MINMLQRALRLVALAGVMFAATAVQAQPAAPEPLFPLGPVVDLRPRFYWSPVPGAVSYDVRLFNETATIQYFQSPPITSTFFPLTEYIELPTGIDFTWTVRVAQSPDGPSEYSAPALFGIHFSSATIATKAPASGKERDSPYCWPQVRLKSRVKFSWVPVADRSLRYRVVVRDRQRDPLEPMYDAIVERRASVRLPETIGFLPYNRYEWQVFAVDTSGAPVEHSTVKHFSTIPRGTPLIRGCNY